MLEVLKIIKEKQQEANRIIDEANIKAEKIKEGLLQKSETVNEEAFLAEISQAEQNADEILKNSSLSIEQEIKQIMSKAEQHAKEIEIKAKANQEKAVKVVLEMLFNRSEEN